MPQPDSCTQQTQLHYSITSSARGSVAVGTARASALAVDRRPPQAAVAKSDAGERCGKRRDKIPAGTVEGGERKRTAAEVSKADEAMSDPRGDPPPGSAWGMPKDCPSEIRHVGGAKLDLACVWNVRTWPAMPREKTEALQPQGRKYRCAGEGRRSADLYRAFCDFAR